MIDYEWLNSLENNGKEDKYTCSWADIVEEFVRHYAHYFSLYWSTMRLSGFNSQINRPLAYKK